MKNKIIFMLLFYPFIFVAAQKVDTFTVSKQQTPSVEEWLSLPSSYTVLKCKITIAGLNREIYTLSYTKGDAEKPWWPKQLKILLSPKGDKVITIGEITVQKGDRQMKWRPKTFVVP